MVSVGNELAIVLIILRHFEYKLFKDIEAELDPFNHVSKENIAWMMCILFVKGNMYSISFFFSALISLSFIPP